MLQWYGQPGLGVDATTNLADVYVPALVRTLAESGDPRLIPLLIDYSFIVSYAKTALVKFGEATVPSLLSTVRSTEDPLSRRGGAISVLGTLLGRSNQGLAPPLSKQSRQQISALSHELLGARFTPGYTAGIAQLALATREADLRKEVEDLAANRNAWVLRGVTNDRLVEPGQRIIKYLLKNFPEQ